MAKNQRTVRDIITHELGKKLSENTRNIASKTNIESLRSDTPDTYRRMFSAAAAVYRASQDRTFRPSEAQVKDYAAAVEIFAQRGHIKPQKDGKFSKDQLETQLTPEQIMQAAASQYIRANNLNASIDEEKSRHELTDAAASVYGQDSNGNQAVAGGTPPQAVTNIVEKAPVYLDDEAFKALDPLAKQEYISTLDACEQNRLNELIKKGPDDDVDPNKVGDFEGRMRDPDWGHPKGDDDYKIEQGDIIEYLMKEVILAAAAWAGNRIAGGVGFIAYEGIAAPIGRGLDKKAQNAHQKAQKSWEQFKDWLSGRTKKKKLSEEEKEKEEAKNKLISSFGDNYMRAISYQRTIIENRQRDILSPARQRFERQIIKHFVVLGKDGLYYPGPEEKDTVTDLLKQDRITQPYIPFNSDTPELTEVDILTALRKGEEANDFLLSYMEKKLAPQNNQSLLDEAKRADIKRWFTAYTNAVKQNNGNSTPVAVPEPAEYKAALDFAVAAHSAKENFKREQEKYNAFLLASMQESTQDPAEKEQIKNWLEQYHKNLETFISDGTKNTRRLYPETTPPGKRNEYKKLLEKAEKETSIRQRLDKEIELLDAQRDLFARHYSFYQMFEEYRRNPDNPIFSDADQLNEQMTKWKLEADREFLAAEQKRRRGEKDSQGRDIPSREQLIKDAEDLAELSRRALTEERTDKIDDPIKGRFSSEETNRRLKEVETSTGKKMVDVDFTAEEALLGEKANLARRQSELEAARMDINEKRKLIDQVKKRETSLTNTEAEVKKIAGTTQQTQTTTLKGVKINRPLPTAPSGQTQRNPSSGSNSNQH